MQGAWEKLDRLRGVCETQIRSSLDDRDRLFWSVKLRLLDKPEETPILAAHAEIENAVEAAVATAERRGWLPPEFSGSA
jgi:hypothetical protein